MTVERREGLDNAYRLMELRLGEAEDFEDEYGEILEEICSDRQHAWHAFAGLLDIIDLLAAVKRGDLNEAMRIQALITPIKEAVYGNGEPTGEAHARMKTAMMLAGVIKSDHVRPPTHAPSKEEVDAIRAALANAGLLKN